MVPYGETGNILILVSQSPVIRPERNIVEESLLHADLRGVISLNVRLGCAFPRISGNASGLVSLPLVKHSG